MGKRNTGRKLAMQLLYEATIKKQPATADVCSQFFDHHQVLSETREWAFSLVSGVVQYQKECDDLISHYAIGWELSRLHPVDLCILRVAFYELLYTESSPHVVLNEAIEIARKYSSVDAPKFINGILGKYVDTCLPASSKV